MPHWPAAIVATVKDGKELKFASDFMAAFAKIGEKGDPSEAKAILGAPKIKLEDWPQHKRSNEKRSSAAGYLMHQTAHGGAFRENTGKYRLGFPLLGSNGPFHPWIVFLIYYV
jgi:hypothetical protein